MVKYWQHNVVTNHLPPIGNRKRQEMEIMKEATHKPNGRNNSVLNGSTFLLPKSRSQALRTKSGQF